MVGTGQVGAGWFIIPGLLAKAEYVNQEYFGYPAYNIKNGGKFHGVVLEGVVAFQRGARAMTLHAIPGGGQRRACRPIVFLFVAMLSMALAQHPRAATADDLSAQLSVREENGVYTVAARFPVDGPAERSVSVLTDYERIPQFMPGVKTSIVRKRQDGRIVIEQEPSRGSWCSANACTCS